MNGMPQSAQEIRSHIKDRYPIWTIDMARDVLTRLAVPMMHVGYVVGMYGSVSKNGVGRDLDLCANPWRMTAEPGTVAADRMAAAVDGNLVHTFDERRDMGMLCVNIALRTGHILDVCFYGQEYLVHKFADVKALDPRPLAHEMVWLDDLPGPHVPRPPTI